MYLCRKTIKDVDHNLKEFDASVNDLIHEHCTKIRVGWLKFDKQLNQLLKGADVSKLPSVFNDAMHEVLNQDDEIKMDVIRHLKTNHLNEV